jgi:hypothetical protein
MGGCLKRSGRVIIQEGTPYSLRHREGGPRTGLQSPWLKKQRGEMTCGSKMREQVEMPPPIAHTLHCPRSEQGSLLSTRSHLFV